MDTHELLEHELHCAENHDEVTRCIAEMNDEYRALRGLVDTLASLIDDAAHAPSVASVLETAWIRSIALCMELLDAGGPLYAAEERELRQMRSDEEMERALRYRGPL